MNYVMNTGFTTLMHAAFINTWLGSVRCLQLLLNAGTHVNKLTKKGHNTLQIHVSSSNRSRNYSYIREEPNMMLLKDSFFNCQSHRICSVDVPQYLLEYKETKFTFISVV